MEPVKVKAAQAEAPRVVGALPQAPLGALGGVTCKKLAQRKTPDSAGADGGVGF